MVIIISILVFFVFMMMVVMSVVEPDSRSTLRNRQHHPLHGCEEASNPNTSIPNCHNVQAADLCPRNGDGGEQQ